MANRSLICSPGRVSRGGMCAASTTSGALGAGAPAAEIVVRAMPAMMPAAIPAAPPASDRMVGRRIGFLLVEIGLDGTGPTRTRGKRLCNRTANSSYSRTRKGDSPEMVVDERLQALLDQGGIALTDDCARPDAQEAAYVNGDLAVATTDALQLFLNEAGRYKLLTAAEEVELAKRIE